jgi:hypothetical protein
VQLKSMVLLSLGPYSARPKTSQALWRENLSVKGMPDYIQVDVNRGNTARTNREISGLDLPVLVKWKGPLPSPGATDKSDRTPRICRANCGSESASSTSCRSFTATDTALRFGRGLRGATWR